jgi:prepilin-type N-terminal cleavage/methylation domain-containing protein
MLNIDRKLSHKGFSLIELMVAAVILAFAVLGIFLAFSTGFQGMADARDRTVATNYAREAMEDVKNMDFLEISPEALTQIEGTKFEREISVDYDVEGSSNLTRVTVRVFWENRKGQVLNIATSMLVNNIEFTAGEAAKILLYVYPYNVILPEDDTTELIAVVKDVKGNTITSWDKDITFTITLGTDLGYLETLGQISVTKSPVEGRATVIFYSTAEGLTANEKGFVTIKAEVLTAPELGFDTVEVTLTWGAVSIALVPDQDSIKINESTIIHAYLKNAAGGNVTIAEAEIIFDFSGKGTLPAPLTRETENGEVSIILTATDTPGIATVTASASNLLSDSVDIYITGPPKSIYVEVNPNYLYIDQTAEVTVTLKDVNGITVNAEEVVNIDLSLTLDSVGQGTFTPPSTILIGIGSSSGNSTFTPTGTGNGTVQAVDSAGVLTTGEAAIFIANPLVADYIEVTADSSSIEAGGDLISNITAIIKNPAGITVFNYIQPITFSTDKGSFSETDPTLKETTFIIDDDNYQDGVATVVLYANNETESGIATITVTSDDLTPGSTEVGFYVEADHIILSSDPVSINTFGKVEDTCTITATIKDSTGTTVENYIGTVTFSIFSGSEFGQFALVGSTIMTVIDGEASIDLRSKCNPGTVVVKATSTFGENVITSIDPHLPVVVTDGGTRDIGLVDGSVYQPANKKGVVFDVQISGGVLRIYNMEITCGSSAKLTKIEIDEVTVYQGSINDGIIVDINPTILSTTGEHNIHITYSAAVGNTGFDIIFNAEPDCGLAHIVF